MITEPTSVNRTGRAITLEQLVALNDEMAALSRAGVPLERGLLQLGEDLPGRLGRVAQEMGRRLEAGESLSQIVSATDARFPPLYRAVVEAGIRSGNLTAALEGLSTTIRRVAELRRLVGISLLYPLAVIFMAYLMFLVAVTCSIPSMTRFHRELDLPGGRFLEQLVKLGATATSWWLWPPLVAAFLLGAAWIWSGRFTSRGGLWGRLPTFGRLLRAGRVASFVEVLRLLVEQSIPLDEAVVLAAQASGDIPLQRASEEMAERLRRGDLAAARNRHGIPPLLSWFLASSTDPAQLSRALKKMAERYRARAQRLNQWMTVYLPMLLVAGIGGSATIMLAVVVLGPWIQILHKLSLP